MRKLLMYLWPVLWLAANAAQAGTAYWTNNFEGSATNSWVVYNNGLPGGSGGWHIGNPAAGPAPHSGTNCASTQGYAYNKDTLLICNNYNGSSTLLVSGDHPRLRFWHWFNLANALGYVAVSPNQGHTWIQVSPTYENINSGGVWSRPSIDLSAFAGDNVLIGFHFISGGCCGNGLGWFVDDVEVDSGTPVWNWQEGFESDPKTNDWSVDFGTWVIGTPSTGPPITNSFRTHAGTNCAGTVLTGNYLNNADTRLISPPFTVPTTGNETLHYWQWYNFNNAQGFVEINNGTNVSSSTNIVIITTNATVVLNTNIYQFFGATNAAYAAPLYWNPAIIGWTNATKTLGSVYDGAYAAEYLFEAGYTPLVPAGGISVDYRISPVNLLPVPQSPAPTNFLAMQGMLWSSAIGSTNTPVGYFSASTNYSYSTNTITLSYQSSWTTISPTNVNVSSGTWTNAGIDLSAYAGQTVQIAFHFQSGGVYSAPGWYVDDLSFVASPTVSVPGTQTMYAGQTLTITNISATNNLVPTTNYTFSIVPPYSTNYWITTNGVLTWTNTGIVNGVLNWTNSSVAPGTNLIYVKATDDSTPPLSATNSFSLVILPPLPPTLTVPGTQTIVPGQTLVVTNYAANTNLSGAGNVFTFSLPAPSTNYWMTTGGVLTWTNPAAGLSTNVITVQVADNSVPPLTATNQFVVLVVGPPVINVPLTQTMHAGQTLSATLTASDTNTFPAGSQFTFGLPASSTNYWITANGLLTWTNTGVLNNILYWTNSSVAPGTNTIFVTVTENSTPPLSATNSFSWVILPPLPPALMVPGNQVVVPGQTLVVTNFATNTNLPAATFTYQLVPPVSTNVTLTPGTGALQWQTTVSAPPGTNLITVAAVDNSLPPLTVTNQFAIVVSPPPVIVVPAPQTIHAGQTLATVLSATNPFLPGSQFTFSLPAPSTNYWISTNGVLTWTNTGVISNRLYWANSSTAPGTNIISVSVMDNSTPAMSAASNFDLVILPPLPPTLIVPANPTIYTSQTLVVTNFATNSVLPDCTYRYAASGPASVSLNISNLATNGVWQWATTLSSAGSYTITNEVTDNSVPALTATNSFVVTVLTTPAPMVVPPMTQAIYADQTMTVTNYTTDSIFPDAIFTYSLAFGPNNLVLGANNGMLQWTPTAAQAPNIYTIYVKVTDNHSPLYTITNFTVLVQSTPVPALTISSTTPFSTGSGFQFTLDTVPNSTWRIDASTNLLTWRPIWTNQSDANGLLQVIDPAATNLPRRYYRAVVP